MIKKIDKSISIIICKIDNFPLWLLGIVMGAIVFAPYFKLGTASVFPWHDQLDENILNYVLPARHFGEKISTIPEMMCGLPNSSLQPYAILFLPLYILFPPFSAFVISYAILFVVAFGGMYFLVYEFSKSNILACVMAAVFAMLPFWPVYGIAVAGVPLAIFSIVCLEKKKRVILSFFLLTVFGLGAHLAFSGFGVLGFWGCWLLVRCLRKKTNRFSLMGFFYLIFIYVLVNFELIKELILGKEGYISHRVEFLNVPRDFLLSLKNLLSGDQHSETYHVYLIIPIILMLILGGFLFKRLLPYKKGIYYSALIGFAVLLFIDIWGAFYHSAPITEWRNAQDNVFRYFSLDRLFWLYPSLWLIEFAICVYIFWDLKKYAFFQILIVAVLLIPTTKKTIDNSYFYMSVNEINNGYEITGYIPWENYYAEDVMQEIEDAIGKDITSYRVAHIGMNPTPALMHGFYTVDGYAGTYPLEYKHKFRKIIEKELSLYPETANYFDNWGSRCYLFNSQCGNAFMLDKKSNIKFERFYFDWDKLKEMGCEYLFSAGEITDYENDPLVFIGNFTSDISYWNVWLYKIE